MDVALLLRRKHFFVTPYGRGQWVSVWADTPLNWRLVTDLLRRSYRLVALKRMTGVLDGKPVETSKRRVQTSRGSPGRRG